MNYEENTFNPIEQNQIFIKYSKFSEPLSSPGSPLKLKFKLVEHSSLRTIVKRKPESIKPLVLNSPTSISSFCLKHGKVELILNQNNLARPYRVEHDIIAKKREKSLAEKDRYWRDKTLEHYRSSSRYLQRKSTRKNCLSLNLSQKIAIKNPFHTKVTPLSSPFRSTDIGNSLSPKRGILNSTETSYAELGKNKRRGLTCVKGRNTFLF